MRDQYGDRVPNDLVVLDLEVKNLSKSELDRIDRIAWYEPVDNNKVVLVSEVALEKCIDGLFDATEPKDIGLKVGRVMGIAHILHRWNEHDGFYHA
jgi:hypothetical protein